MKTWGQVVLPLLIILGTAPAQAWTEHALNVSDPFVFTPNDLALENFELAVGDKAIERWRFVPGSLEWVRIEKKFVVPRALVDLKIKPGTQLSYQSQNYVPTPDGRIRVPLILSQEKNATTRNQIFVSDAEGVRAVPIRFLTRGRSLAQPVAIDTSCSSLGVRAGNYKLDRSWVYIFCKSVHPKVRSGHGLKVDLDVYWETEGDVNEAAGAVRTARVNRQSITLQDGLTFSVALDSQVRVLDLERGEGAQVQSLRLETVLPDRFHPLSVALGIGPYSHQNNVRGFATLYASYHLQDSTKLATFGAFPVQSNPEFDWGVYLISEQVRTLDERLLINLLLGAHTLSYVSSGSRRFAFSAPQGVELVFRDFAGPQRNLIFGGFFYPSVGDRSYLNVWARYGGSYFAEINFIQWQEPLGASVYGAKSFGLSVGFPLFRAL